LHESAAVESVRSTRTPLVGGAEQRDCAKYDFAADILLVVGRWFGKVRFDNARAWDDDRLRCDRLIGRDIARLQQNQAGAEAAKADLLEGRFTHELSPQRCEECRGRS
jgi:hypothetical protein